MELVKEQAAIKLGADMRTWIKVCAKAQGASDKVDMQNFGIVKITDEVKEKIKEVVLDNGRLSAAAEKLSALSPELEAGLQTRLANIAEYLVGDDAQRDGRREILGWSISNKTMLAQLRAAGIVPKADSNKPVINLDGDTVAATVNLDM